MIESEYCIFFPVQTSNPFVCLFVYLFIYIMTSADIIGIARSRQHTYDHTTERARNLESVASGRRLSSSIRIQQHQDPEDKFIE